MTHVFTLGWQKNEVKVMKSSMIASVREDAGLGCPPTQYTINRNENVNRITQQYCNTDNAHSTWAQLSDRLFALVMSQRKEVERPSMEWVSTSLRITIGT